MDRLPSFPSLRPRESRARTARLWPCIGLSTEFPSTVAEITRISCPDAGFCCQDDTSMALAATHKQAQTATTWQLAARDLWHPCGDADS